MRWPLIDQSAYMSFMRVHPRPAGKARSGSPEQAAVPVETWAKELLLYSIWVRSSLVYQVHFWAAHLQSGAQPEVVDGVVTVQ